MTTQQQETAPTTETVPQFGDANFKPAHHADDDELAALEAELAKEASGGNADAQTDAGTTETGQEQQPEGQAQTTQETQPAAGEQRPQGGSHMVPKARLDEVLRKNDELTERLLRLEGAVGAIAMGKQAGTPVEEPEREKTPEERMEAIRGDIDKLAERYEAGEISTREWARENTRLQETLLDIRQEVSAPRSQQSDTYLAEQTDQLARDFPVLNTISAEDVEAIVPLARREAAKQNIDISSDLKLRRHIASFAQNYYGQTQAPGGKPQGQGQPTSPNAAARKLDMARAAPPNLNQHAVAYSGSAGAMPTQERVMQMSDDEFLSLPAEVQARIANGQSAAR